jgi:amino acid transporter
MMTPETMSLAPCLRRNLGTFEAFGLSLSIIAPTASMVFVTTLTAQSAGKAVPLAFLLGAIAVIPVCMSFVNRSRRVAHAGSVYAYVGDVFGRRWGFLAAWALLLMYLAATLGSTILAGNFVAAGLNHLGIHGEYLPFVVELAGAVLATRLVCNDMQMATRVMLLLEIVSVIAILILSARILWHAHLSFVPFELDPAFGWSGLGRGIGFTVLCFAGFEGAATLGEEAQNPGRNIGRAMLITVMAAGILFVVVSFAQVTGYGPDHVSALAQSTAPLDELATRYASERFAAFIDFAAAVSLFGCAAGALSAGSRLLYALARTCRLEHLCAIHPVYGTPTQCVLAVSAVNFASLIMWGGRPLSADYAGDMFTVGTFALILVYMGVSATESVDAFREGRVRWSVVGLTGAVLLLWPLWNNVYPVPAWPANLWPRLVVGWLLIGALLGTCRPFQVEFRVDERRRGGFR